MNLQQETRNGFTISTEMKKVWAIELELLKKLLEVCEKHHLRIWAEGGTLLGAVREKGFIPWDDDIDMAMPREDYDKLQTIAKDQFKAPFFFQSGYTDIFPYGMTKLRMDGTTAITVGSYPYQFHQGIFIDIFPLDVMPDNESEQTQFIKEVEEKRAEMKLYCNHTFSWTNPKYNWNIIKLKKKVKSLGFNNYFKEYDDYCKQFSTTNYSKISLVSWKWQPRYLRDRKWYNDTILLPFEDNMMPIPSGYDAILKTQYGDYMTPKKAPTQHGGFAIVDTEKSYKDYLPILRKNVKKKNLKYRIKKLFRI